MALSLVTSPVGYPVTLAEARAQCLIPEGLTDQDALLESVAIPAACERGEGQTARAFLTQTWDLELDGFPGEDWIELPKPPLQEVVSVTFRDPAGQWQTWAPAHYVVSAPQGPRCRRGRLALASGESWPSTRGEIGDVVIRFVCGYGGAAAVPALLKQAQLLDIGTMYADRENLIKGTIVEELPGGVRDIYRRYYSHATQRRGY